MEQLRNNFQIICSRNVRFRHQKHRNLIDGMFSHQQTQLISQVNYIPRFSRYLYDQPSSWTDVSSAAPGPWFFVFNFLCCWYSYQWCTVTNEMGLLKVKHIVSTPRNFTPTKMKVGRSKKTTAVVAQHIQSTIARLVSYVSPLDTTFGEALETVKKPKSWHNTPRMHGLFRHQSCNHSDTIGAVDASKFTASWGAVVAMLDKLDGVDKYLLRNVASCRGSSVVAPLGSDDTDDGHRPTYQLKSVFIEIVQNEFEYSI